MKLKEIVYNLWRNLEGGYIPDDTRYTYGNIRVAVVSVIGDAATSLAMRLRNAIPDDPYPTYVSEETVEVKYDSVSGVNFVELKSKPLSFNGKRTYDVNPSENSFNMHALDFVPILPQEWFALKKLPRVPKIVYYIVMPGRLNFLEGVNAGDKVSVSQSFSIPTAGDELTDDSAEVPDEIAHEVSIKALTVLREQLKQSDRANDGVPVN